MPIFYFVPDREADTFKMPLTAERLLRSLGATAKMPCFRCPVYMIERIQEKPDRSSEFRRHRLSVISEL